MRDKEEDRRSDKGLPQGGARGSSGTVTQPVGEALGLWVERVCPEAKLFIFPVGQ